jgi:hypothetical protein
VPGVGAEKRDRIPVVESRFIAAVDDLPTVAPATGAPAASPV